MKEERYLVLGLFVVILLVVGTMGFKAYEGMNTDDAFLTTVQAMTFTSASGTFSDPAKLLNSALSVAALGVLLWAFINFHYEKDNKAGSRAREYFNFAPEYEPLVMREITIKAGSHLANKTKIHILESTGAIVFAVKKGSDYELNVPFTRKLVAGTSVLAMGVPTQLNEVVKRSKKK